MDGAELVFDSKSPAATDFLAQAIAQGLSTGLTIALIGELGAGKTRFVQGLAAALGVRRDAVVSPTFVLCQQYSGRREIYHYDLYRLKHESEFWALGAEESFTPDAIVVIEWADRFPQILPSDHVEIRIEASEAQDRAFRMRAFGANSQALLSHVNDILNEENPSRELEQPR